MHFSQGDTIWVLGSSIAAISQLRMNMSNPPQLIVLRDVDEEISHVRSRDQPAYVLWGYSRILCRFDERR